VRKELFVSRVRFHQKAWTRAGSVAGDFRRSPVMAWARRTFHCRSNVFPPCWVCHKEQQHLSQNRRARSDPDPKTRTRSCGRSLDGNVFAQPAPSPRVITSQPGQQSALPPPGRHCAAALSFAFRMFAARSPTLLFVICFVFNVAPTAPAPAGPGSSRTAPAESDKLSSDQRPRGHCSLLGGSQGLRTIP